jgi:molybdopterin-binding protein
MATQGLGSQYPAGRGAPLGTGGGNVVRTFFCTPADAGGVNKVAVSPGSINSEIHNTFNADGSLVTATTVEAGSSLPANTGTEAYALLATVAIVSGATVVTPYAWDYSQAQSCGLDEDDLLIVHWW